MLVSDAMPSVGAAMTSFVLNGRSIKVADRKLVDEEGRLAGADLDMATAVRNTVRMLGMPLVDAVRMASANPADFLALRDVGRIAPGQRANLVLLNDELQVRGTWIDGEPTPRDARKLLPEVAR
jgi:N-acetylglucosamine-6-phosphate deacetylase